MLAFQHDHLVTELKISLTSSLTRRQNSCFFLVVVGSAVCLEGSKCKWMDWKTARLGFCVCLFSSLVNLPTLVFTGFFYFICKVIKKKKKVSFVLLCSTSSILVEPLLSPTDAD